MNNPPGMESGSTQPRGKGSDLGDDHSIRGIRTILEGVERHGWIVQWIADAHRPSRTAWG